MNWTEHKLEDYGRFILRRGIRAFLVPADQLSADAAVHPYLPLLFYSTPNLPRATIWHECGHIKRHEQTGRLLENPSVFQWTIAEALLEMQYACCGECGKCVGCNRGQAAVEEAQAHLWAMQEARRRGYLAILAELAQGLNVWDDFSAYGPRQAAMYPIYAQAKRMVVEQLKNNHLVNAQHSEFVCAASPPKRWRK